MDYKRCCSLKMSHPKHSSVIQLSGRGEEWRVQTECQEKTRTGVSSCSLSKENGKLFSPLQVIKLLYVVFGSSNVFLLLYSRICSLLMLVRIKISFKLSSGTICQMDTFMFNI